jgi:hypothetical protein
VTPELTADRIITFAEIVRWKDITGSKDLPYFLTFIVLDAAH